MWGLYWNEIMRNFFASVMLLFVLFLAVVKEADDRPNIIVFYTDDHGHADLSCQGVVDDIRTPHVDALAGLEFWQGMVTARLRNVFLHVRVYWLAVPVPLVRVTGTLSTDSTPN